MCIRDRSDGGSEQLRKIEELKNCIEQKNEIIILKTDQTEEIAKGIELQASLSVGTMCGLAEIKRTSWLAM